MRSVQIVAFSSSNGSLNSRSPHQAVLPRLASREDRLQKAKARLLEVVHDTARGSRAAVEKRGEIEEAQVAVEEFSGPEADWALLAGTWRVVYTTAPDVVPLVRPFVGLPLRIGAVGQRFSDFNEGRVENLIEVELLGPFVDGSKLTLAVEARFEIRTGRSIAIMFQNAGLSFFRVGDALQNFLAPPLLPRGYVNMVVLMALSQVGLACNCVIVSSTTYLCLSIRLSITNTAFITGRSIS